MSVYFYTLAAVSVLMILYGYQRFADDVKLFLFILVTAILLFVAGFRFRVGTDYTQYARNYVLSYSKFTWQDFSPLAQPGAAVVAWFAKGIHHSYKTWFFLMSLCTVVPAMIGIYRNSQWKLMSVLMYLFLGCWHFPFNIVKQGVAAAILFLAYPLLRDRHFWKWCLCCLAAAMFHISALLMIPIYFLARPKITKWNILVILAISIVCMFAYDFLYNLMAILKQGSGMIHSNSRVLNTGVNILRILVHCSPVALFAVFHEKYDKEDKDVACLFNLAFLNAALNVASMNSVYLNRFSNYTIIYNVLFFPILLKPLKGKRLGWIKAVVLILFFAFWTYDLYKGSTTSNYQWIFSTT